MKRNEVSQSTTIWILVQGIPTQYGVFTPHVQCACIFTAAKKVRMLANVFLSSQEYLRIQLRVWFTNEFCVLLCVSKKITADWLVSEFLRLLTSRLRNGQTLEIYRIKYWKQSLIAIRILRRKQDFWCTGKKMKPVFENKQWSFSEECFRNDWANNYIKTLMRKNYAIMNEIGIREIFVA